jgi:nucleotidyltransferase substrate binding protein (TIGR01987 family)
MPGGEEMNQDISSLIKAITRLDAGLTRYQSDIDDEQIRDGLIQRFEFTYELAHKMLKRYLETASPTPGEFEKADFQYVIRSANEQGLLRGDWSAWQKFREMRAKTSHTYDADVALEVVKGIPAFLEEACHLRDQLQQRIS